MAGRRVLCPLCSFADAVPVCEDAHQAAHGVDGLDAMNRNAMTFRLASFGWSDSFYRLNEML